MKNKLFALAAAVLISTSAFSQPVQQYIGISVTAEAASVVSKPTASKKSGTFIVNGSMKVTLSCATKGASIYYSTNGGTYRRYTKAIYIKKNTTLKFYAVKSGVKSKVVTRQYKLAPKVTSSVPSGTYDSSQTVKLSSKVSGVKYYYTLDGSKPTRSSTLYTAKGIKITDSCKLRILTYKSGWTGRYITMEYQLPANTTEGGSYSSESILEKYRSKYAYSTLTETQKTLYEKLYKCVEAHEEKIDVSSYNVSEEDVETAFYAMDYDNPQFFWLASGYNYTYSGEKVFLIMPAYSRTKSEAAKIAPKLEAAAAEITDTALLYDDLFYRVLHIHDSIVNMTTYTTLGGEYKRDADGPLLNGKALCEGYAKAFAYLCQSIGIEAICVAGHSGEDHMWNMVKLDGQWYHMDVTFDDPVSATPTCSYEYFCITTDKLRETHSIRNFYTVPKATATAYNYYNATGVKRYTNATEAFTELCDKASQNYRKGEYTTEIVCDSSIISDVYTKLSGSVYLELSKYGCEPAGAKFGYIGNTVYLELSSY